MNDHCGLCGKKLTSIDQMLGENRLSDGNVLCNTCLEKASNINQALLSDLHHFSIDDIKNLIQSGNLIKSEDKTDELLQADGLSVTVHTETERLPREFYKRRLREIKAQLKQAKANLSVFTKGEIKELPYILAADEPILAVTDAQFLRTVDAGILLVTPKRIVSVSKAMFGVLKVHDYPNETITGVNFRNHFISPVIIIHTEEKAVEFECFFDKDDAQVFYDFIKKIYNKETSENQQANKEKVLTEDSVFEQLEKLAMLRENGILTEEEFTLQKKKFLEKL
ncbi:PH domain-containing protein [Chryseobacterium sp. SSA4.19]|uniref:PH domain-containing protein n=1 Tax=Chryseobacterium sp. SSA4.19 TaxID=2919915 RepID=UPI001F4DA4CC|nr:PH domain-containing protein [Chryseobacterium sp. SSA4.19]MCJ8153966.1 PH domain-containing protein [Chryseobacterium sp. SSA4.19]